MACERFIFALNLQVSKEKADSELSLSTYIITAHVVRFKTEKARTVECSERIFHI